MIEKSPLLTEMDAIKNYIEASRAIIKDGYMPDMTSLTKRIAELCEGIQAADAPEQNLCLPKLAVLLKALNECENDLRIWNEAHKASGLQ